MDTSSHVSVLWDVLHMSSPVVMSSPVAAALSIHRRNGAESKSQNRSDLPILTPSRERAIVNLNMLYMFRSWIER